MSSEPNISSAGVSTPEKLTVIPPNPGFFTFIVFLSFDVLIPSAILI